MVFVKNAGAQIPENGTFCAACGAPVAAQAQPTRTPEQPAAQPQAPEQQPQPPVYPQQPYTSSRSIPSSLCMTRRSHRRVRPGGCLPE